MFPSGFSLCVTVIAAVSAAPVCAAEIVFDDFEKSSYGDWKVEGVAFGDQPATGAFDNQNPVEGFEGAHLVNSYVGGDESRGRLTSPKFRIEKPFVAFLIGGGPYDGRTCMNLVVDGKVVRTATGAGDERLAASGWDVRDLRGKTAHLEIVDDADGGWGHVNVDRIAFTDSEPPLAAGTQNRDFAVNGAWLNFPVRKGAPMRTVTVTANGEEVRRFHIELDENNPEWWAPLDVRAWKGKTMTVSVDKARPTTLEAITNADSVPGTADLYAESLRPQFHFSARRGWINDPNGLVFYNGEYHLFFQHNPYGTEWGNMHWGHAVSKDLVHWREVGEALYPDEWGTMYSGGGVVDWKNTTGFGSAGKPPMIVHYTAAGEHMPANKPYTQGMAWTTDGRTFTKYEGHPIVDNLSRGNRDPKVYWHEPTRKWVMALWGEEDGGNVFYFLNSPDMKKWTLTQTLRGDAFGNGRFLHECPDFFELPVDGDEKNRKWVVFGATGEYGIGSFDGRRFRLDETKLPGPAGDAAYAGQTFADEPNGRRVWVGWFRAPSPGMPFNHAMTLPMELRLTTTPDGVRLTHTPVEELKSLRGRETKVGSFNLASGEAKTWNGAELMEVRSVFRPAASAIVTFEVRGVPIIYDAARQELSVAGTAMPARLQDGVMDLAIFVDRTTVEVVASRGEAFIPVATIADAGAKTVRVSSREGSAEFQSLDLFELRSAWRTAIAANEP